MAETRIPTQKRSIEKRNKIIKMGFDLMCDKGYHNISTTEIAEYAGVSTGIIYQYFNDKKEIFIEGVKNYANDIMFPMLNILETTKIDINNIDKLLPLMINKFIENHKLSQQAHEEITAMTHSDKEIAEFFHKHEIKMTENITNLLIQNGFNSENLSEKVHIIIGLIDNLCHEIVYHKHSNMNYDIMTNLVLQTIVKLINE